jgi:hypothetical protein
MTALAVVSNYVVTNRAPYLKCDRSVSVYVAVVWIPDHPTGPDLREGLCQTMLSVTRLERRGLKPNKERGLSAFLDLAECFNPHVGAKHMVPEW